MIRHFPMGGGLKLISLGKIVPKITRQLIILYLDGKEGWVSLSSTRPHSAIPHHMRALLVNGAQGKPFIKERRNRSSGSELSLFFA